MNEVDFSLTRSQLRHRPRWVLEGEAVDISCHLGAGDGGEELLPPRLLKCLVNGCLVDIFLHSLH